MGLAAAGMALALPSSAEEKIYIVQKSDTLSSIAQKHGVSVTRLAEYNLITKPNAIKAGQKLRIPSEKKAPALPDDIASAITRAKVKSSKWKYVVIHHSATDTGSAKGMDIFHQKERHMENGLAYHFVIGNGRGMGDGEIAIGRRWTEQLDGGHLHSEYLNSKALGVCLVGNFEESKPTEKQMANLHALIASLMGRCKLSLSAVKTHQQINTVFTRCPGKQFPMKDFLEVLKG